MAAFTNPSRLTLIALCAAIFGLGQFHRAAGSVFTPVLMDRFALSATAISGLVSAMFTAAVLAQIPLGVALDRYGPRLMLCCSMVVIAIGTALFAVGQDYETILAARIVIGLGTASLGASSYVIVARSFPEREFGYANGMIITLGGLGGLTGTYPLAMALSSAGWTASFAAVGAMTLVLALMVAWIVETPATGGAAAREGPKQGYLSLLRMPEMRRILVMGLATFAPITTITGIWAGRSCRMRWGSRRNRRVPFCCCCRWGRSFPPSCSGSLTAGLPGARR